MSGRAKKSTHKVGGKKHKQPICEIVAEAKIPTGVVGEPSDQEYEIAEIGPIYVEWRKSQKRNDKGKIVWQLQLKEDSEHCIWVKWVSAGEETWTAEPQSCFGPEMDDDIQKVLKQKIAWPWPQKDEDGYKKQSDPKKKSTWALEGALAPTDIGFGDQDDQDESERDSEDEDEEDEV